MVFQPSSMISDSSLFVKSQPTQSIPKRQADFSKEISELPHVFIWQPAFVFVLLGGHVGKLPRTQSYSVRVRASLRRKRLHGVPCSYGSAPVRLALWKSCVENFSAVNVSYAPDLSDVLLAKCLVPFGGDIVISCAQSLIHPCCQKRGASFRSEHSEQKLALLLELKLRLYPTLSCYTSVVCLVLI